MKDLVASTSSKNAQPKFINILKIHHTYVSPSTYFSNSATTTKQIKQKTKKSEHFSSKCRIDSMKAILVKRDKH